MFRTCSLVALVFLCISCSNQLSSSDGSNSASAVLDGKAIFQQYCGTCHSPLHDVTGPAMKGAMGRWDNDTARLFAFIRNPAQSIKSGDPAAVKAYEKFKPAMMTGFPDLSNEELEAIINFAGK